MYRMLREKAKGLEREAIDFAKELVRTPSPSLKEGAVAGLVASKMNELGYDKVFRDEAGNVVGILFGREKGPNLLCNSHMDCVDVIDEMKWQSDPYSGEVRKGQLFGRGASDCKAGLSAQVYAGELLKRSLLPLKGNLIVAATVAEENGRSLGVRTLMDKTLPQLELMPTYAVLGEPTELGVHYGHDGWVEIDIKIEGANPFHVDDAARAVYRDFGEVSSAAGIDGGFESIALEEPSFKDDSGRRRATIRMARRLIQHEKPDGIVAQLQHSANSVSQMSGSVAVQVQIRQEDQKLYTGRTTLVRHVTNAWSTDPFHPVVERTRQCLSAAGCEVRPAKWQLDRLGMGTAGSVLVNDYNTPTVGYGPGSVAMAHAYNESVDTANIVQAIYGTAVIVHGLIGIPVFGWTVDAI